MVAKLDAAKTSHEVHHIQTKQQPIHPIQFADLADLAACLPNV